MGNEIGNKLEPPRLGFRRKKAKPEKVSPPADEQAAPAPVEEDTAEPVEEETPEPVEEETPEPVEAPEDRADSEPTEIIEPEPAPEPTQVLEPVEPVTPEPQKAERAPRPPRERRTPAVSADALGGHPSAALTGLLVGLFMVLAVWGCERVSQAARGTTSLGRAGFPLLVAIFILAVALGAVLLRRFRTPSPASSSFLGTGLVSVLSILFLTDHVDNIWGSALVVLIAIVSYVLARWVSVRYIGE